MQGELGLGRLDVALQLIVLCDEVLLSLLVMGLGVAQFLVFVKVHAGVLVAQSLVLFDEIANLFLVGRSVRGCSCKILSGENGRSMLWLLALS